MLEGQALPPHCSAGLTARNSGGQLCNQSSGFCQACLDSRWPGSHVLEAQAPPAP